MYLLDTRIVILEASHIETDCRLLKLIITNSEFRLVTIIVNVLLLRYDRLLYPRQQIYILIRIFDPCRRSLISCKFWYVLLYPIRLTIYF